MEGPDAKNDPPDFFGAELDDEEEYDELKDEEGDEDTVTDGVEAAEVVEEETSNLNPQNLQNFAEATIDLLHFGQSFVPEDDEAEEEGVDFEEAVVEA